MWDELALDNINLTVKVDKNLTITQLAWLEVKKIPLSQASLENLAANHITPDH